MRVRCAAVTVAFSLQIAVGSNGYHISPTSGTLHPSASWLHNFFYHNVRIRKPPLSVKMLPSAQPDDTIQISAQHVLQPQILHHPHISATSWQEILSSVFISRETLSDTNSIPIHVTELATIVQTAGEAVLAALLLIAAIQGAFIMKQYSSNPLGELIVPPGPTIGVEDASTPGVCDVDNSVDTPRCLHGNSKHLPPQQQFKSHLEALLSENSEMTISCTTKKGWYYVNQVLVLLLPFVIGQWSLAIQQFGYLFHMACILGITKIYDMFKQLPEMKDLACENTCPVVPTFGEEPHIVIIGDSMSVGIGCVNKFDLEKNSGILYRIEQVEPREGPIDTGGCTGPIFPRVLARTLSMRLGRPVSWRSGGVDGGDTNDIRKYLLPIIQEEVERGKAPDVVVVLTGSNDLKHILSSNPENGASVRGFRFNLIELTKQIRAISPHTTVVYPALPTYRLDHNSVLNVFPLSFFLGGIISLWDTQKYIVAQQIPGGVARYVAVTMQEVHSWYGDDKSGTVVSTLTAPDGIHPNAYCYRKWAQYVGNYLVETMVPDGRTTSGETVPTTGFRNVQPNRTKKRKPIWGV